MNIIIKEYQKEESEDLRQLFKELQNYEKSIFSERAEPTEAYVNKIIDSMVEDVENKQGKIYFAFEESRAVGYGFGYVEKDVENDTAYFFIDALLVTEDQRGKGIGEKLIAKMEEYAMGLSLPKIQIGVLAVNKSAYKLYKKLGFKDYGIELLKDLPHD